MEYARGNVLDLFAHKYTRSMITDPAITIPLTLNGKDLDTVYALIRSMGLFNYPQLWRDPSIQSRTASRTRFDIHVDSLTRHVTLDVSLGEASSDTARQLRELKKLIIDILETYPNYKTLPEPEGAWFD